MIKYEKKWDGSVVKNVEKPDGPSSVPEPTTP